jgi:hypothetical protein
MFVKETGGKRKWNRQWMSANSKIKRFWRVHIYAKRGWGGGQERWTHTHTRSLARTLSYTHSRDEHTHTHDRSRAHTLTQTDPPATHTPQKDQQHFLSLRSMMASVRKCSACVEVCWMEGGSKGTGRCGWWTCISVSVHIWNFFFSLLLSPILLLLKTFPSRARARSLSLSLSLYIYIYIYISPTHTHYCWQQTWPTPWP